MFRGVDVIKEKISDFFYDLFNPPVEPYIFKLDKNIIASYLNYFLYDEGNIYINKDGVYSFLYKISLDSYLDFISILDNYKLFSNFDLVGFSLVIDDENFDFSILFWVSKSMSIDPNRIDVNYKKMLNLKLVLEKNMRDKHLIFSEINPDSLFYYVSRVSWYEVVSSYDDSKPLSFCFDFPELVLRDEVFYSPKDIYMVYSLKSTYLDSLKDLLSIYPYEMKNLKIDDLFRCVALYTVLLKYEGKFRREVLSFVLFKFLDGVQVFKGSEFYSYDENFNCVNFSFFERFVSGKLIREASEKAGVNLQREQKNLSFFYGLSTLPFNFLYEVDLSNSKRAFHIHWGG